MSKSNEYCVRTFRESVGKRMIVRLGQDFRELLLEMTLAYLVDQPPDVIEFALTFLKEKRLERLSLHKEFPSIYQSSDSVPSEDLGRSRRFSVFVEHLAFDDDYQTPVHLKTEAQKEKVVKAMDRVMFFYELGDNERRVVRDAMKLMNVSKGETVIQKGAPGDNFYVVEKGVFEAVEKKEGKTRTLMTYANSGWFGELALMYNTPRACSVVARTDGVLWALDRNTFRRAVLGCRHKKRIMHEILIDNVPMLAVLQDDERSSLADSLISMSFSDGECIIKQGEEADGMYFIESGVVRVRRQSVDGKVYDLKHLKMGDYFGELALITFKKRAASVYAVGSVRLAFLRVEAFERLLGRCIDIMKRNINHYESQLIRLGRAEIHTTDFR